MLVSVDACGQSAKLVTSLKSSETLCPNHTIKVCNLPQFNARSHALGISLLAEAFQLNTQHSKAGSRRCVHVLEVLQLANLSGLV